MAIKLNENQLKAVHYTKGDLLIIAGAGTGKTSVITQRIIHLIKEEGVKPSEILALTFTEKAASEMQERIDMDMEYGYDQPWISTFHSFCDRILRKEGYHIGVDGGYTLMSTAQAYIFLRKYYYDLPLEKLRSKGSTTMLINGILKHFSRLQDEDVSPEDYLSFAKGYSKKSEEEKFDAIEYMELAKTYSKYSELKLSESKLDFGDLIILTLKLFRERPNILAKYRKQFKYILVDEFQDTNYTQNVLVNLLTLGIEEKDGQKERPYLTVVGDDDQAIYKFRGAAISNILQFKETYPDAMEVVLVDNYRSRQEILDASYGLICKNNPNRLEITEKIDKKLVAMNVFKRESDIVSLIAAKDENLEAERVVEEIAKLTGYGNYSKDVADTQKYDEKGQASFVEGEKEGKYKFSDIAILVRANSQADPFVQALRNKGIAYKLGGSRGLYFRPEIQNIISFLKILVDYNDGIAMYRLLSMPVWNISPRKYMELNRIARERKVGLFELIEQIWNVKLGEEGSPDMKEIDQNMVERIFDANTIASIGNLLTIINDSIGKVKDSRPLTEIMYEFVKTSGYLDSFLSEENAENMFAVSNIQKFFELTQRYEKDNKETNIYEYVDFLDYCMEIGESPIVDQSELEDFDAVNIMTVHGAKGLEYPVVFMVNLIAQRFPTNNRGDMIPIPEDLIKEVMDKDVTESEAHIQEERRLFYVGATRAKEKLFLCAASFYGDGKSKRKPSIFLNEILDRDVSGDFNFEKGNWGMNMDNYKEGEIHSIITDDVKFDITKKFSYSQLDTYEMCPRKYEYAYVLKVPQKPNAALSFGTTIHNTLHDFYELLRQSKEGLGVVTSPTIEDMVRLYEKNWLRTGYESSVHEKKRKEKGKEILGKFFKEVYSEKEKPLNLEESFDIPLGDGVFNGKVDRIDLVDEKNGVKEVCIVDYKTGRVKDADDIKGDLQLPLYSLFVEQKLGYRVVGAKYIFVEEPSVVEVDVSNDRRELAKEKLFEIVAKIKAREFLASPGRHCSYCDYKTVCEFAQI